MKIFSKYIIDKLLECRKYIDKYKEQPVITCIKKPKSRIVAIGDIHGDIELMLNTLKIGNVIEKTEDPCEDSIKLNNKGIIEYYNWIGEDAIVVQVGDQIDRCRPKSIFEECNMKITYDDEASDIEILLFFTNLHEIAKNVGGAVYSLLGNHELMNSFGNISYVSYENLKQVELENFEGEVDKEVTKEIGNDVGNDIANFENRRKHIFRREGILSKFLACTRSSILIVNGYLFAHGGIFGSFINYLNYNDKYAIFKIINDVVKHWLMNKDDTNLNNILNDKYCDNVLYNNFFKNYNNITNFILNTDSPFWIRKLGNIGANIEINDPSCDDVKKLTRHFNLKGIIVGHTPQLPYGINGTCSNKLFRIDIASSKAFYHVLEQNQLELQVLEINKHNIKVLKIC